MRELTVFDFCVIQSNRISRVKKIIYQDKQMQEMTSSVQLYPLCI